MPLVLHYIEYEPLYIEVVIHRGMTELRFDTFHFGIQLPIAST